MSSQALWEAGRSAWPFEVPAAELAAACAHFEFGSDSDAAEVYLAVGCQLGIPAALQHFETDYLVVAPPLLRRQGVARGEIDEILQRLRELLLVLRDGERYIRLLRYAGTGRLRSLVRVSAARAGVRVARSKTTVELTDAVLGELWSRRDPEAHVIDAQLHELFKTAFQRAILTLPDHERALLRFYFVEELSYQQIATLFGLNRSTICRQLAAARARLLDGLITGWQTATGTQLAPDLSSLLDGELDLSVSRLLRISAQRI